MAKKKAPPKFLKKADKKGAVPPKDAKPNPFAAMKKKKKK